MVGQVNADLHGRDSEVAPDEGAAGPARPYHKGNVAKDLLKAATRLMQKERLEDISVRRLAREVDVSPRNFYNHFESMDDLFFTLAARRFDRRVAVAKKIMAQETSRKKVVVALAVEFVEAAVRDPELFRVMFGRIAAGSRHKLMGPASVASFRLLVKAVYGDDRYRVDDLAWSIENCETAYSLFSLEYGLARNILDKHIRPQPNTEETRRRIVESIVGSFVNGTCGDVFREAAP